MIYKNIPKKFNAKFETVSCFMEYKNKILLLHRHNHKLEGNKWGVPAGKIEKGEKKAKALMRELFEETGHKVSQKELEYLIKVYVKYPEYHFTYHMFKTKLDRKISIKINKKEHKKYKWVLPNDALKLDLVRELDRCIRLFY